VNSVPVHPLQVNRTYAPSERCDHGVPDFDESTQGGYWLVRPDGSPNWAFDYLRGLINGSVPVPAPPV
jgi:hypothetical protein